MRVFVYFNLHKKMWSVKALEGPQKGRVIARTFYVPLRDVRPRVSQKGRERVLKEKVKNVHAGIVGQWYKDSVFELTKCVEVTYNPYKYSSFVTKINKYPIKSANIAMLSNGRVFVR